MDKSEKEELTERFMTPGMRYGDVKKELFECFWSYFEPFREKRIYLENHKDFVFDSLNKGAEKASLVAERYISKARNAMGLNFGAKAEAITLVSPECWLLEKAIGFKSRICNNLSF